MLSPQPSLCDYPNLGARREVVVVGTCLIVYYIEDCQSRLYGIDIVECSHDTLYPFHLNSDYIVLL